MNIEAGAMKAQSRIGMWFDHHAYSLVASLGRMLRKPWATALTVGVMAMALALPLGLWASLQNVERLAGSVQHSRQVSLFLKPDVAGARARVLADELAARPDVARVELRTPEQGLEELRARGFGDSLAALEGNPLPSLLLLTPKADASAGDETALRIIDGLAAGLTAEQIRTQLGISRRDYDSARKRMRRCLLREGLTCGRT